eukprot:TRINITY_DN108673_c0_g1_i1.p1 TRINITY_DN108673_c0_g1~~TRINITY_DN108673_c0_g1_i1.p1  ORF type:complete len:201 (-),score=29.82 TRINITY_DN108673_c0_g1_i1:51-653(-)
MALISCTALPTLLLLVRVVAALTSPNSEAIAAASMVQDDECFHADRCTVSMLQKVGAVVKGPILENSAQQQQSDTGEAGDEEVDPILALLGDASQLPPGIEKLSPNSTADSNHVCGEYLITDMAAVGCCGASPYYYKYFGCCGDSKLFRIGRQGCCHEPGSEGPVHIYDTHKQLCCQRENKVCRIEYTRYSCCTGNAGHR